jgi:hypothetical protein
MRETWLRPNRRAIWFGCVPLAAVAALGAWLACGGTDPNNRTLPWIGAAFTVGGLAMVGLLLAQLWRPRIAYRDGQVLFYLRAGQPIAVPAGVVEAFFLGQGSAKLPGGFERQESVNLVARISQRATEWSRQEVKPSLGNWCDGYVTIRGTWCEPLGTELVRRLNRRLKEVQTEQKRDH